VYKVVIQSIWVLSNMIYLYFIFLFLNCILYIYRQLQFTIMRRVLQRVNVIVPSDWLNYFLREI